MSDFKDKLGICCHCGDNTVITSQLCDGCHGTPHFTDTPLSDEESAEASDDVSTEEKMLDSLIQQLQKDDTVGFKRLIETEKMKMLDEIILQLEKKDVVGFNRLIELKTEKNNLYHTIMREKRLMDREVLLKTVMVKKPSNREEDR